MKTNIIGFKNVFKNLRILMLWTKVALALEGFMLGIHTYAGLGKCPLSHTKKCWMNHHHS